MIEIRITITATALTIGSWLGRKRLRKIQIGRVSSPAPIVNVVTMISSKERAKASRPPATRARLHAREGDVAEGLPGVGAEVGRGLLEGARDAAQAGDDVVVDDDDAEGGVADDHREEAEVDAEDLGEGVAERDAGDDARQGDRQDRRGRRSSRGRRSGGARRPARRACRAPARSRSRPSPALIEVRRLRGRRRFRSPSANQSVVRPGGGHSRILLELKA